MENPTMHYQKELEVDLNYNGILPDHTMIKWFKDSYSTSKHLLTLYSIASGLSAKTIVEIGFGRSSFVLAKVAKENNGHLISCDMRDFSYLLNETEKSVTTFIHGTSAEVWPKIAKNGIDFAFLDYFSGESLSTRFIVKEINACLKYLRQNGIIAVHDSIVRKYNIYKGLEHFKPKLFQSNFEVLSLPYNYGLGLIRKKGKSRYGSVNDQFNIKKIDKA